MTKASEKAAEKAEAIKALTKMGVKPGATIYTSVTHVSSSGMSRHIRCYIVTRNTSTDRETGKKRAEHGITEITGLVATACGFTRARGSHWDIVIGGAGMDMCFKVVYDLGCTMFPKGGTLAKTNYARRMQAERAGETVERNGGYLLNKRDL